MSVLWATAVQITDTALVEKMSRQVFRYLMTLLVVKAESLLEERSHFYTVCMMGVAASTDRAELSWFFP